MYPITKSSVSRWRRLGGIGCPPARCAELRRASPSSCWCILAPIGLTVSLVSFVMAFLSCRVIELLPGLVLRPRRAWVYSLYVASALLYVLARAQGASAHPRPSLRRASVHWCCPFALSLALPFHRTRTACAPGRTLMAGPAMHRVPRLPVERSTARDVRRASARRRADPTSVTIRTNSVESRARPRAALIYEPMEEGCNATTNRVGRGRGSRARTAAFPAGAPRTRSRTQTHVHCVRNGFAFQPDHSIPDRLPLARSIPSKERRHMSNSLCAIRGACPCRPDVYRCRAAEDAFPSARPLGFSLVLPTPVRGIGGRRHG